MKSDFIYWNPIFILEVKKRLADKIKNKLKMKLITKDKLIIRNEESQKNSQVLSQNESKTNYKYFMKFIKEKAYKSDFRQLNESMNAFFINKNKAFDKNKININLIKGIPNIIKLYNEQKNKYHQINKQKHNFPNQSNKSQTPFQINHNKNSFFKQYIKFTTKKNSINYIPNENSIKSYSINSSGQRKKIFGTTHTLLRNLSDAGDLLILHKTNKTLSKLSSGRKRTKNCLFKDHCGIKNYNILKPNCYYNRINLRKYCIKENQ